MPIAKSTGQEARRLDIGDKEIIIPAGTMLIPSHVAVHTHPRYWGDDSLNWRPSRWLKAGNRELDNKGAPSEEETLITPRKGSFIACSEGIRNCPGKKFSQVEFVAAMATLFYQWRVDPVPQEGEDMHMARKRIMKLVEEETGQVLLLQMLRPERAVLKWTQRGAKHV